MANWLQEEYEAVIERHRTGAGIARTLDESAPNARTALPDTSFGKLEAQIEAECTKFLEADGWRALRTDPVSNKARGKGFGEIGMADHLYIRYQRHHAGAPVVCLATAEVAWIEFKRIKPSGQPTGAQKKQIEWAAKERARGALTLIAGIDFPASEEGFKAWYAASGLQRRDR